MKKILFLLLISIASYGQADFPEGINLGGNTATAESSKIVSQQPGTGELNYINATALPVSTAVQGSLDTKENVANKQNSLAVDGTGTKYPTVDAVNTGLDLKALDSNVVHKTGEETIGLGEKYFTDNVNFNDIAVSGQAIGRAALYPNEFVIKSQLDLKANLASPTFTGTVSGIDKTMVGLTNVDNTSDANKPISTATQTALNGKENSFAKNTAFNKNFGTTAGTVAGGNDSRILNGQTAFGWGNHASAGYALTTGSNINQAGFRSALGLGSNAYTSTAYLPLTGGNVNGLLKVIGDGRQLVLTGSDQGAVDLYKSGTLGHRLFSDVNKFGIYDLENNSTVLSIAKATEAATFSSTVTATSFNGSATLTGTPTAPTAPVGTNTTQIATTAFVQAVNANVVHKTGNETISGNKSFDASTSFPDIRFSFSSELASLNQNLNNFPIFRNVNGHLGINSKSSWGASISTALLTVSRNYTLPDVDGSIFIQGSVLKLKAYTVGTLPAGKVGDMAYVTDALTPTYLTAVVGGGTVVCPVFYNGVAWVAH